MKRKRNEILRQACIEADIEYFDRITKHKLVDWTPSEEFERKMERLIRNWWHPIKGHWSVGKAVACALLVFTLLTGSMLSVEAIREPVFEFFTKIYDKFTSVFVVNNENSDTPITIETEYLPTTIPEDYVVLRVVESEFYKQTSYVNDKDMLIIFTQQTINSTHCNFDTENTELHPVTIHSFTGQYYINKGYLLVSWIFDEYTFFLSLPDCYTIEEAVMIAESVKPK